VPARIVELELWLPPHRPDAPLDGRDVAERCRSETGLAENVVLGLNFVPDLVDVENLRDAMKRGEFEEDELMAFFVARGLQPNQECERSAAEFLSYARGQPVAWLHLPAERSGVEMARTLASWARSNGLQLRDGESSADELSVAQVEATPSSHPSCQTLERTHPCLKILHFTTHRSSACNSIGRRVHAPLRLLSRARWTVNSNSPMSQSSSFRDLNRGVRRFPSTPFGRQVKMRLRLSFSPGTSCACRLRLGHSVVARQKVRPNQSLEPTRVGKPPLAAQLRR
jgi:hypothetical protein